MTLLDIDALPHNPFWNPGIAEVNLNEVVMRLQPVIDTMMSYGVITAKDSFGYALADPQANLLEVWDDPSRLIAMVVYWGPEGPRYAANACRKIRPAAREGMDSEDLRRDHKDLFRDTVPSKEGDTEFEWGDFPWDGAVYTRVQGRRLLGAVSALPKEQDPVVARLITGFIGFAMFESDDTLRELALQDQSA
jgi:hypothetical protein